MSIYYVTHRHLFPERELKGRVSPPSDFYVSSSSESSTDMEISSHVDEPPQHEPEPEEEEELLEMECIQSSAPPQRKKTPCLNPNCPFEKMAIGRQGLCKSCISCFLRFQGQPLRHCNYCHHYVTGKYCNSSNPIYHPIKFTPKCILNNLNLFLVTSFEIENCQPPRDYRRIIIDGLEYLCLE